MTDTDFFRLRELDREWYAEQLKKPAVQRLRDWMEYLARVVTEKK